LHSDQAPFTDRAGIRGLKVTVMGLGLNGGGLATARFFAENGARVTVTDKKSAAELAPSIEALAAYPDIRYVLGSHELSDFSDADIVIKNPGVKLAGNEFLAAARCVESDVSVFLRLTRAPILAVTGSKGKSSTVSALHFGLVELGYRAFLGGNITVSPLTFLDQTSADTPVVLELSSWQLADLRGRGLLRPRVAILTHVMPDHQNWYGGMEPYVADKKQIYAGGAPSSRANPARRFTGTVHRPSPPLSRAPGSKPTAGASCASRPARKRHSLSPGIKPARKRPPLSQGPTSARKRPPLSPGPTSARKRHTQLMTRYHPLPSRSCLPASRCPEATCGRTSLTRPRPSSSSGPTRPPSPEPSRAFP